MQVTGFKNKAENQNLYFTEGVSLKSKAHPLQLLGQEFSFLH